MTYFREQYAACRVCGKQFPALLNKVACSRICEGVLKQDAKMVEPKYQKKPTVDAGEIQRRERAARQRVFEGLTKRGEDFGLQKEDVNTISREMLKKQGIIDNGRVSYHGR